jgi:hypothetical protein
MAEITNIQIRGPVVVIPLDEYLEIRTQLEEHRRLKAIYEEDRELRFRNLFRIADRYQDASIEQVEADVAAAVKAVRSK